jgi:HK97 gp10 family phage protein
MSGRAATTGLESLRRSFRDVSRGLAPIAAREVHHAAESISDALVDAAPVLTGETRDSIRVVDGPKRAGHASSSVEVGGDHVIPLEFGSTHSTAHPFVRRTFDSIEDRVSDRLASGIEAGIRKLIAR